MDKPQMDADEHGFNEITEKIIGCAYTVANALGYGYLEKVYENALRVELQAAGLQVAQQVRLEVQYRGVVVGEYVADLVVEGQVLVELKCARQIDPIHIAQCLNYLKATGLPLSLLINFTDRRVQIKRIISNQSE